MPWMHLIFTDASREKLAEHGVSEDEVEQVMVEAEWHTTSRSSGLPIALGRTGAGRRIVVVYRTLDSITCEIVTAYER